MTAGAVGWHLLESTLFAGVVALLVYVVRERAAWVRHALWVVGVLKFAVPSVLVAEVGARFAPAVPLRAEFAAVVRDAVYVSRARVADVAAPAGVPVFEIVAAIWIAGTAVLLFSWWRVLARGGSAEAVRVEGILRARVVIPAGLERQLSALEFESVLRHEMAHVRRWDNLTGAIVRVICCAFWFHPLVWWMERRSVAERERACDEAVLAAGSDAEEYVRAIAKVCRFQVVGAVVPGSGMTGANLQERMEWIMNYTAERRGRGGVRWVMAAAMAIIAVPLGVGFLGQRPVAAQTGGAKKGGVSCAIASVRFPAGTVVRNGGVNKVCTERDGHPAWEKTNLPLTESAEQTARLEEVARRERKTLAAVCTPAVSDNPRLCACEETGRSSFGAIVRAAPGVETDTGRLRCMPKEGGGGLAWRPATAAEVGVR